MRQKATWIIPGILITLLLGILWAMPASAAKAGNIEFLDERGGDEVGYVSLDGPAAIGDGIWVQVTDSDLDTIVKRTGDKAYEVSITANENVTPDGTEDWHDVQDMNGDGKIDNRDFGGVDFGADNALGGDDDTKFNISTLVTYSSSNGTLQLSATRLDHDGSADTTDLDVDALEYWIKKRTVIGAREGDETTGKYELSGADPTSGDALEAPASGEFNSVTTVINPVPQPPSFALLDNVTWLDIMETLIPDIRDEVPRGSASNDRAAANKKEDVEETVEESIKAYNTLRPKNEPDLTVGVTFTVGRPQDDENSAEDVALAVTISDTAATSRTPGATIGEVPDDTVLDDADPPAGDADALPDDSSVTVEFTYKGHANVAYKKGIVGDEKQSGRVTVNSNGYDIDVILQETGAATGIFGASILICDSIKNDCTAATQEDEAEGGDVMASTTATSRQIRLPVNMDGDTIRIRYRDAAPSGTRTATIPLDGRGPSFNGFSPESGTAGREDEPTVSFTVIDGEAGISDDDDVTDSVYVIAGLYEVGDDSSEDDTVYMRDDLRLHEVTGGYDASVSIQEGEDDDELNAGSLSEYEIRWWAVATDLAGNVGVSDADGDTKCILPSDVNIGELEDSIRAAVGDEDDEDYKAAEGCDPNVVRVDSAAPELSSALTGLYLDGDDEKSGSTTSVAAIFSEALDCDTVSADDFLVDDVAPNAAACEGNKVYLAVGELDSNETPDVEVVEGGVSDRAGNAIGAEAEVESEDGIPAALGITVEGTGEGDRQITDETITIGIVSDERLSDRPTVQIRKIGDDYSLGSNVGGRGTPTGTANEWEFEDKVSGDGLYNVYVTATDRADSGDAIAGLYGRQKDKETGEFTDEYKLSKDDLKSDKIILFEVDSRVQPPTFMPEDEGSTDDENVFIRINFASEGKEYGLGGVDADADPVDETREATDDPAEVDTDFDTSGLVEITSATFDGKDVTDDIITRDWILFVYRPGGLTDGDHKLEIEVMDKAGNEDEFSVEFSKTPRKPYKLPINPGPNLISFPANPADGDVNAVFGGVGNEDIMSVVTFDNASGLWMTATRGADGMFMGDLTTVDAMHGYWVVSDGVLDLSVTLSPGNVIGTPPFIAVAEGWNLVPVIDSAQSEAGTGVATNEYFANIDAQVVYGYDSLSGALVRLSTTEEEDPDDQDMVETGSAYWVYANEAGIIIP